MSGTDHKHPTFGVCTCGHLAFMHKWTETRVPYQGECKAKVCKCEVFHSDGKDHDGA